MNIPCNHKSILEREEVINRLSCPNCLQEIIDAFCKTNRGRYWYSENDTNPFYTREECVSTGICEVLNAIIPRWMNSIDWAATTEVYYSKPIKNKTVRADICIFKFDDKLEKHENIIYIEIKWGKINENTINDMIKYEDGKKFDLFWGFFWQKRNSEDEPIELNVEQILGKFPSGNKVVLEVMRNTVS